MAIKSSNSREKERQRRKIVAISSVVGVIVLYIGLVLLSCLSSFDLYTVNVEGNETIETNYLEKQIQETCTDTWFLFSKKNILICPLSSVRARLISEWPRIETLKISRAGFHTVSVKILERKPVGQTCKETCLVFDQNGFLFRQPLTLERESLTRWSGVAFLEGDYIMPTPRFHSLTTFFTTLSTHIGRIKTITLVPPDIEIVPENGIKYLFEEEGDYTKAIRNIDEFTSNFIENDPNRLKILETIDARFGNKFFYTLKPAFVGEKVIKKEMSTGTSTKR